MNERPHGYARYRLDGCRCYVCACAVSRYDENRAKAITAGTWNPWTDAEPVRVHIRFLQSCDMGLRPIAAAAGVNRKQLQYILGGRHDRGTGPQPKCRPALAAAVLAVEPTLNNLGGATVISALGTLRRLRALVAAGWSQERLAVELGMLPTHLSQLIHASSVIVSTARRVVDLYDRLWKVDPAEHGAKAHDIARVKARAAAEGWAPVGAWDEDTIDDPAAAPNWTGHCGTTRGAGLHEDHGIPLCPPCRAALDRRQLRNTARALSTTHA
ncbi:helix-turn-helix domain-containing protein [Streptomyces chartreusis]|uniref:helix-turn-helix domain-containing protein n=1 Tax=Streptomyces chartreusis TaxID=1969 RepID=UPI003634A022